MTSAPTTQTLPTMQDVVQRLHDFWKSQGCLIWQPHSEKVGAGTMNPATILRVLGPEPWNVAYVEPSYRADDGRYAENPNRMQMHNQYQVILKPDPGNPQELYLGSLAAIGLDRTRHDIRFVEDNWQSPALGAWGLGWEVWLDGQEITQYTYFQQAGSLPLDPISVEITYGLDRIVMYLQNKTEVWSIDVDSTHTFGELYRLPEVEHCVYNFEVADVRRLKLLFDLYQEEAEACIEKGLVTPAHDLILRQSHTFNLLDARGAIGVTERAKYFADMRTQARAVSELYLEQRVREEYPWLPAAQSSNGAEQQAAPANVNAPTTADFVAPQDFVLELGSEELPAQDVVDGINQLRAKMAELLQNARLQFEDIRVQGTPRRLAVSVHKLAHMQTDEVEERRGPSIDRAYDDSGQPTRAAQGFAKGQGIAVSDLVPRDGYVYAVNRLPGRPVLDVLPEICSTLLDSLRWNRVMRWNSSGATYPRPLRWIVALYAGEIVPFTWAGIQSGRQSRGARFNDAAKQLAAGGFSTFTVRHSTDYAQAIADQGIIIDRDERRDEIVRQISALATTAGGTIPDDPDLLEEVTDLVEAPCALLGLFDRKYLNLPTPVLIGVMKKHQRYFPVLQGDQMLPNFIAVANSRELAHPEVVKAGNEGVLRARYSDAAYFYRQDLAKSLDAFTERLSTLTFHEELGSMLDKVHRLEKLAPEIAKLLGASPQDISTVERAAVLCKSDLVTSLVVEMTSLQGIMGEIYARRQGIADDVALAIREHYLPRFAGDQNPSSTPSLALSLADKLDSLVGLFAVGAIPTGSADPFGLRRAALGVVNNLLSSKSELSLSTALGAAASLQPIQVSAEAIQEVSSFLARRLQGVLLEAGFAHDVVEAVMTVHGENPAAAASACQSLQAMVGQDDWSDIFTAYARCARITRSLEDALPLAPNFYQEQVEQELHSAFLDARARLEQAAKPEAELARVLRDLADPINAYFEQVLVNADDPEVRSARLALVQKIAQLPADIADLSRLQGF